MTLKRKIRENEEEYERLGGGVTSSHNKSRENVGRAKQATNSWAGTYTKRLVKEQMEILRGVLAQSDVETIRKDVSKHFKGDQGWTLFSKEAEAVRFYPLSTDDSESLGVVQGIDAAKNGVSLDKPTRDAMSRILQALSKELGGVELENIAFKYIAAKSKGRGQPMHVDVIGVHVCEIIVPLTKQFTPTIVAKLSNDLLKNCSRMAPSRRMVLSALRLLKSVSSDKKEVPGLKPGDVAILDASQPHAGPAPGRKARFGIYMNVRTSNSAQGVFAGRYVNELGFDPESDPDVFKEHDQGVRACLVVE